MKIINTNLNGVLIIKPKVFEDSRGYFVESFNLNKYQEAGLNFNFVQDNVSKSRKGIVRGLHYQIGDKAQGKLCFILYGSVLDVAVDIRFNSPTFGKYHSEELSAENYKQLWIPPGFAHGFSVLSDFAIFAYKCTDYYSKEHERAILYSDPELNIDWKVELPIVSEKDKFAIPFNKIEKDFIY